MKGSVTVTNLDIKTIQEQITKFDMMLRPCALFINPSRVSELKESIPDIEEKFLIVPSDMVPDDTFYLIDRKDLTPGRYLTEAFSSLTDDICETLKSIDWDGLMEVALELKRQQADG